MGPRAEIRRAPLTQHDDLRPASHHEFQFRFHAPQLLSGLPRRYRRVIKRFEQIS